MMIEKLERHQGDQRDKLWQRLIKHFLLIYTAQFFSHYDTSDHINCTALQ